MANMKIQYVIAKHATANPSNLLAAVGGEHIYNIKIATDTDNGCLIAPDLVGDMVSYDVFNEASVNGFSGKIVDKMSNGNWLVFVENAGNACLVYQTPIASEEWANNWKKESNMYNKAGDVVRCYALHEGDRFEVSTDAFSGEPTVGGTISSVTGKKMTIDSGAASSNIITFRMTSDGITCGATQEELETMMNNLASEPIYVTVTVDGGFGRMYEAMADSISRNDDGGYDVAFILHQVDQSGTLVSTYSIYHINGDAVTTEQRTLVAPNGQ